MSSRRRAQEWPYPRRKPFIANMQQAAARWFAAFKEKYATP